MTEEEFNHIELFAGAGGLALGLEMAGFTARFLTDWDRYSCQTLRANKKTYFPKAKIKCAPVEDLDPKQVLEEIRLAKEDIALISGGPPCQGFSIAKTSKGGRHLDDPRNNMFLQFAKFVDHIRPRAFLLENVPGLTNMAKGFVLKRVLETFKDLDYRLNHGILNAADYGVPQIRKRFFLIGHRGDSRIEFPAPTHSSGVSNVFGFPPHVTIAEAFSRLTPDTPNQERPKHTQAKIERLAGIKPGSSWQGWHFRDTMDRPSRTITGHCRDDWVHPTENRAGTVREMAALQSFPNDYVFKGPIMAMNYVKFNFQYRQVGNAVPVLLAKAIGESIIKRLREEREVAPEVSTGGRRSSRLVRQQ
jgi:DNA (cytosine-5)-methyltransferase 1